ncbi:MAG: hypothetical protein WC245_09070 [Bacteroidales bacterium]|nr:hypothetical protein [Acholeplasmataceae bacterium]
MDRKEEEKIAKIVGEMTHYLLKHNIQLFDVKVHHHEESYVIIFQIESIDQEILIDLKDKMKYGRDEEIEAYGWTLMGNTDLEIAPRLLDNVVFEQKDQMTIIKLIRNKHER